MSARRRAAVAELPPRPRLEPFITKFGWCLDGHHENCPARFDAKPVTDPTNGARYWQRPATCSCACHTRPIT